MEEGGKGCREQQFDAGIAYSTRNKYTNSNWLAARYRCVTFACS